MKQLYDSKIRRILAIIITVLMIISSANIAPVSVSAASKKSLKMNYAVYTLKKGKTLKLKVTGTSSGDKVTWKSSKKSVVTVSNKGVVKAVKKGKATVTATVKGKKKAKCVIYVGTPVSKVTPASTSVNLKIGETASLGVKVTPTKASYKKLSYTSSSTAVATVDNKGNVTAVSAGNAEITVKAMDGSKKKAKISVTVAADAPAPTAAPQPASEATVAPTAAPTEAPTEAKTEAPTEDTTETPTAAPTDKATPEPTSVPEEKEYTVSFNSNGGSNANSVKVKEGSTVSAPAAPTKAGKTFDGWYSDSDLKNKYDFSSEVNADITLYAKWKNAVAFSVPEEITIGVDEDITPELTWVEGADKYDLTWESDNEDVAAIISEDGKIHGIAPGTCTVTVASKEEKELALKISVTISNEGVNEYTVTTIDELTSKLAEISSEENAVIYYNSEESEVTIPEGTYDNVTLIVDAPACTIINYARFRQLHVKAISSNTWIEQSSNRIFMSEKEAHMVVGKGAAPNLFILGGADSVTVDNNGNLKSVLISRAVEVLLKGDSTAKRVDIDNYGGGRITTFLPVDITSSTTFDLRIGEGGEQTAVLVDTEGHIPSVSGLGTITITIGDTGEKRNITADFDEEMSDLVGGTKTKVFGKVISESNDVIVDATVYLVPYTIEMTEDNTSVYLNKSATRSVKTNDEGAYEFDDVIIGNYSLVVEAEGYQLIQNLIMIDTNYDETRTYEVSDICLTDAAGTAGGIAGEVIDTETGEIAAEGLTVMLRKGMNNITSSTVDRTETDENGEFFFDNLIPGQYTIQIRDDRDDSVYSAVYENVAVMAGTTSNKTVYVSKNLSADDVRFVLTWGDKESGASQDLDLYVYGPDPYNGSEFLINRNSEDRYESMTLLSTRQSYYYMASIDVDDKDFEGPETVTINNMIPGRYKIFVQDYSNGNNSDNMYESAPVIRIYTGSKLKDTITLKNDGVGGNWYVGDYDAALSKMVLINELSSKAPNTSDKAKIGTVLNKLEQFTVIDPEAFKPYQQVIDEVKSKYVSEKDATKVATYLSNISKVLNEIKESLTIDKISGKGFSCSYGSYKDYHYFDIEGEEKQLEDFNVVMAADGGKADDLVSVYEDGSLYRFAVSNVLKGVSTLYYISYDYSTTTINWIDSIKDPGNEGWKSNLWSKSGVVGGYNKGLSHSLDIKTGEADIIIESMEYRSDIESDSDSLIEWKKKYEYYYDDDYEDEDDRVDLVLHLKKTSTGQTCDYEVRYVPLGAELEGLVDPNNTYISQDSDSYYSWQNNNTTQDFKVVGVKDELGSYKTDWTAVVTEGAEYTVEGLSEADKEDGYNYDAKIIVTRDNGAKRTYRLYYYPDTSDAAIIGIYDDNNIFTNYSEYSSYYGKNTYSIYITGNNSELGHNLSVAVNEGAQFKIEYVTSDVSWDSSSDAKITVTAKNGRERIYYISYSKATEPINIRSIKSTTNNLKLVYMEYSTLYILGDAEKLGDLQITCNTGYTATQTGDSIVVTDDTDGTSTTYDIEYTRDISGLKLKSLTSEIDKKLSCSVSTYLSYTFSDEEYYNVNLIGNVAQCPKDLAALVSNGAVATITYAADVDEWPYDSSYVAKVVVTKGDSSVTYLVQYSQDDSGAEINSISETGNTYIDYSTYVNTQTIYYANPVDGNYGEQVYFIEIVGKNASIKTGEELHLGLSAGSTYTITTPDDEEWNYSSDSRTITRYDSKLSKYIITPASCVARIEVTAANGAKRVYVVVYGQDDSGATITSITDPDNQYIYSNLFYGTGWLDYKDSEGEYASEYVTIIELVGSKAQLGNSFEIGIPEGSTATKLFSGEEGWSYTSSASDIDIETEDTYISVKAEYAARIEVTAANGAKRVYVVAYGQDTSGAAITSLSDDNNPYIYSLIDSEEKTVTYTDADDNYTYENVYCIKVIGNNASLGKAINLEIPEGATATIITPEDDDWKTFLYPDITIERYDEESSRYIYTEAAYEARIEVTAANGVKRVYVVAYGQDASGADVRDITDSTNSYVHKYVDDYSSQLNFIEAVDGKDYENVYEIKLIGSNSELGSNYKLVLPDGAEILSTITPKDSSWNYNNSNISSISYYDSDDNNHNVNVSLAARVEVKAKNGVKKVYAIVYGQDNSGTEISRIVDGDNEYLQYDKDTSVTSINYVNNDGEIIDSEQVYCIRIIGNNTGLGKKFTPEIPEGSTYEITTPEDDEWKQLESNNTTLTYYKDYYDYYSIPATYAARIKVTAENGTERVYYIIYGQDNTGAVVTDIADENNNYKYKSINQFSTALINYKEPVDGIEYEVANIIQVVGENAELGDSYTITMPEGTTVTNTLTSKDDNWNYEDYNYTMGYYDEDSGNYLYPEGHYAARLEVTAANGAKDIYVIVYAQAPAPGDD